MQPASDMQRGKHQIAKMKHILRNRMFILYSHFRIFVYQKKKMNTLIAFFVQPTTLIIGL